MLSIRNDLHIHTEYSDGCNTLCQVLDYAVENKLERVCITDHNTMSGSLAMAEHGQWLPLFMFGLEFRLPGLPDFLLYFPQMELAEARDVEASLRTLCDLDQDITIRAARDMFEGDVLSLWHESPFFNFKGNFWLGTLQLGQLLSGDNWPGKSIIADIRKKKSEIFRTASCSSAKALQQCATLEWVTSIAKKYSGHLVLAHPFREIAHRYRDEKPIDRDQFNQELDILLAKMRTWKINCLEHIYSYKSGWWNEQFAIPLSSANEILFNKCVAAGIRMTSGSDSHNLCNMELEESDMTEAQLNALRPDWL